MRRDPLAPALALAFVLSLAFAATVWASHIYLTPHAGVYTLRLQASPDADVVLCGIDRVDDPNAPVELSRFVVTPSEIVAVDVEVPRTKGVDAELRAWCEDGSGNRSEYSIDHRSVDFTPPGRPSWL